MTMLDGHVCNFSFSWAIENSSVSWMVVDAESTKITLGVWWYSPKVHSTSTATVLPGGSFSTTSHVTSVGPSVLAIEPTFWIVTTVTFIFEFKTSIFISRLKIIFMFKCSATC